MNKITIPMSVLYDLLTDHRDLELRTAVYCGCERKLRELLPDVIPPDLVDVVIEYILREAQEEAK